MIQGGHKPGKLRESEKLSKSQGKLREIWTFAEKIWKTQGKWKICDMIADKNALTEFFFSWVALGKSLKYPRKLREFGFSKMWSPCDMSKIPLCYVVLSPYLRWTLFGIMTTLAGGFLVINYHDAGRKVSKSNLDRGRKQKRPLRQTAVDAWRGWSLNFLFVSFLTKELRNQFRSAPEKGLKIKSGRRR